MKEIAENARGAADMDALMLFRLAYLLMIRLDLPEHHRTPAGPGGDPRTRSAPGQAEPAVGAPAHPGRDPQPRAPHRRGNHPADPGRRRARPRAAPDVTAHPTGAWTAQQA